MARRLITSALVFGTVLAAALPAATTPPAVTQTLPDQVLVKGGTSANLTLTDYFQAKDVTGTTVRVTVHVGTEGTGAIDLELFDTQTPLTVANFLAYINAGRYTNNIVHRTMHNFVIQDGGYFFQNNGQIGLVPTFPTVQNEFALSNVRGTVAMAKVGTDPNSASSQWFINLSDNSANLDHQNGGFTVFGHVLGNGMAVADIINNLPNYDATAFVGDWGNLSLTNTTLPNPIPPTANVQIADFIITSMALVPPLSFTVSSDNAGVATAAISGNTLTVTPHTKSGHANITVTAGDLDNGQTQATFEAVIPGPTVITANPPNTTAAAGNGTTIAVEADGGPAVTYQWQRLPAGTKVWVNVANGEDFTGATTATLGLTATDSGMSGDQYRCVITNPGNPTVTSKAAILTVDFAPAFLTTPANVAVKAPAVATFKASSMAIPAASYRWQFSSDGGAYANLTNGPGVVGVLTSALKITSNASITGFHYRYIATNSIGSTVSAPGILTVTASPKITVQPMASLTANVGDPASFSVTATGNPAVTYQWKKNNVAIGGATNSTLTIDPAGKTDAATYTVVVSNGVAPAVTSKPAKLVVDYAPSFTLNPIDVTKKTGTIATFKVVATGNPAPTYHWQVMTGDGNVNLTNNATYTGVTTPTLNVKVSQVVYGNSYVCVATNLVGHADSGFGSLKDPNASSGGGTTAGGSSPPPP